MAAYLLDHKNPHGDHFYPSRQNAVTIGVIHTGENEPDTLPPDHAGERLLRYAATTSRAVSWHDTADSDSHVLTLPYTYTGWHVRGYNSRSVGVEQGTKAALWPDMPDDWVEGIITQTASAVAAWVRMFDLPLRLLTKQQVDVGMKGIIGHDRLDPSRRSDPGRAYPWAMLLTFAADQLEVKLPKPEPEVQAKPTKHEENALLDFGDRGNAVTRWQRDLVSWRPGALPVGRTDGIFGGETREWTRLFQKWARITADGIVGPVTRSAMKKALAASTNTSTNRFGLTPTNTWMSMPTYPGYLMSRQFNSRARGVASWQRACNYYRTGLLVRDGVFGRITDRVTKSLQREMRLKQDGIVGPATWGRLRDVLR